MTPLKFFDKTSHSLNELRQVVVENPEFLQLRDEDGNTALFLAIEFGLDFVELLLEKGANVNARNQSQESPLHQAAEDRDAQIAQLLIEYGASPVAKDTNGNTPLHIASAYGAYQVVKVLIGIETNLDCQNNNGFTPLHYSVFDFPAWQINDYLKTATILLDAGANSELCNRRGESALDLAQKRYDNQQMIELLSRYKITR